LEVHESAAELTLWLMIIASVVRIGMVITKKYKGIFQWISLIIFLAGVFSVARTGYYGGELVFKHAAGVQFNMGLNFNPDNTESPVDSSADVQKEKNND
jgi:uncharacterized membrane protein